MPETEQNAAKAQKIEAAKAKIVLHLVERGVNSQEAEIFVEKHAKFDSLSDGQLVLVDEKWLGGITHVEQYAERLYARLPAEQRKDTPGGGAAYDPVAAGKAAAAAQKKDAGNGLAFR